MLPAHRKQFLAKFPVCFLQLLFRQFFVVIFRKLKGFADQNVIQPERTRFFVNHHGNDRHFCFDRHHGRAAFERKHFRVRLIPGPFGKQGNFLPVSETSERIHHRADIRSVPIDGNYFQLLTESFHKPIVDDRLFGHEMNSLPGRRSRINNVPDPVMIADVHTGAVFYLSVPVKPKGQAEPKNGNHQDSQEIEKSHDMPPLPVCRYGDRRFSVRTGSLSRFFLFRFRLNPFFHNVSLFQIFD